MRHRIRPEVGVGSAGRVRVAFTLVELLVVIAVIALLLAIFVPVIGMARERGQRAVCLSNLRQLTMAWITYAEEHGGKLVFGETFAVRTEGNRIAQSWAHPIFRFAEDRASLIEYPHKGALWPYLQDVDIYRCPRGKPGHALTYTIVAGANGGDVEGTYASQANPDAIHAPVRVGSTVVRLTRITDIVSPGAGQRAVFLDNGYVRNGSFLIDYVCPRWLSPPPIHHRDGATLSTADGQGEGPPGTCQGQKRAASDRDRASGGRVGLERTTGLSASTTAVRIFARGVTGSAWPSETRSTRRLPGADRPFPDCPGSA